MSLWRIWKLGYRDARESQNTVNFLRQFKYDVHDALLLCDDISGRMYYTERSKRLEGSAG